MAASRKPLFSAGFLHFPHSGSTRHRFHICNEFGRHDAGRIPPGGPGGRRAAGLAQRAGGAGAGRDSGTPEQRRDKGGCGGKKTFPPTAGRHDAGRTVQDAAGAQRPPLFRTGGRGDPASRGATDRRSPPASAGLVPVQTMMGSVAGIVPAGLVIKARDRGPKKWGKEVLFSRHGHREEWSRRPGPGGDRRRPARRPGRRRRHRVGPRARRPRNGGTMPRPSGGLFGGRSRAGSGPIGRADGAGIPAGRRVTGRRGPASSASSAGRRPAGLARDGLKPDRRGDRRRADR